MSTVSVVIPCYNYGHYLRECVQSVIDIQPGVDVRVLIVDDASTDDSAATARQIADERPQVEVAVHRVNQGHIATYNEGLLDWADGDYTVLLSADDRLTPGALCRAVDLLDARPQVGFVYGHPVHFQSDQSPPPARTELRGWSVWSGHWWLERRFRAATGCITSPEVVVRTTLQRRVGGYDARLTHSGDIEMWMRLAVYADVGYLRGVDQAYYRVHGRNMSSGKSQLENLSQRLLAYQAIVDQFSDQLPHSARWSDRLRKKLASEALRVAARAYDRGRVDRTPVAELTSFAVTCWPDAKRTQAYKALRLRQLLGPSVMPYLQPLVISAATQKAQHIWWRHEWTRRGL